MAHRAEKRYLTEMVVEGADNFPIDMLRYDRCVPATEEDANKIAYTFSRAAYRDVPQKQRIVLIRYGVNSYQIENERRHEWGRWESFGWKVVSERWR